MAGEEKGQDVTRFTDAFQVLFRFLEMYGGSTFLYILILTFDSKI